MFLKKIKPSKLIISMAIVGLLFSAALPVAAQINGLTTKPLSEIINDITVWILGFAAALAILFIVVGGIYYVTAGGNEQQMETAKTTITYAIWGIFLVAVAYSIVVLVNKIVGT